MQLPGTILGCYWSLGEHLVDKAKGSVSRVMSKFLVIPNYILHAASYASHVYWSFAVVENKAQGCILKATIPYQLFFVHIAFANSPALLLDNWHRRNLLLFQKHPRGLKRQTKRQKQTSCVIAFSAKGTSIGDPIGNASWNNSSGLSSAQETAMKNHRTIIINATIIKRSAMLSGRCWKLSGFWDFQSRVHWFAGNVFEQHFSHTVKLYLV